MADEDVTQKGKVVEATHERDRLVGRWMVLAGTLTQRMGLLVERGVFESAESLATSAYRSLLTLQPALKLEIALSLYQGEEISLGRAAEMAGVSREQMKEILAARGIERKYPQRSQEQVDRDVRLLLERR